MYNINTPSLSFCITCKNRFHQISKTLLQNLNDNRMFSELIEFVLVDFGSVDGLYEWVINNFKEELASGYLKYYYTEELPTWHASIAKNTSHLLGNNEILVNLDCDNFTGYNGGRYVIRQFVKYGRNIVTQQFSGDGRDGSFGRIGVLCKFFLEVRGYDEDFEPMASQDRDLINRLKEWGLEYYNFANDQYNNAIPNTKDEGILYTDSKLTWFDMFDINMIKCENNLTSKKFVVNEEKWGIRKNIFDANHKPITVL